MSNLKNLVFLDDGMILLKGVRLSYPHLFKPYGKEEGKEKKFSAAFMLPKASHLEEAKAIHAKVVAMSKEAHKSELESDRYCLKNGDKSGKPEYMGHFVLKANEQRKPGTRDANNREIAEEDDVLYAGCYVNVVFRLWAQNNGFGKRINANLLGVQFAADGERMDTAVRPDLDDVFAATDGVFADGAVKAADDEMFS